VAAATGTHVGGPGPLPRIHENEHRHFIRDTARGVIFCELTPLADLGDDPAELDRGYRWCMCFTPVCPQGEGGHVHVSRLTEITSSAFEEARHSGWRALAWK